MTTYAPGDNDQAGPGPLFSEVVASLRTTYKRQGVPHLEAQARAKTEAARYFGRELARLLTERDAFAAIAAAERSKLGP